MYSWYTRSINPNGQLVLEFEDECCLGGCKKGIVAQELRKILSPNDNAYMGWSIPIAEEFNREDYSFIIDIKPKKKDEVFLCEFDTVFGYSYDEWSPVMLRLKLLCSDITSEEIDKKKFIYPESPAIIYTMLYLYGSIRDGELIGTWNLPYGSITALLFWPEAMTFFYEQVKLSDPSFLEQEIKVIESLR